MTTRPTPDRLAELLAELSYRKGRFQLASGRESDFYVDVKQTVFRAEGTSVIGSLLCDRLLHHDVSLVGGMAVGAIPLAVAALAEAAGRHWALDGFFVRKEIKEHGTAQRLDGRFDPSAKIALVEDVVTTGDSTLSAVDAVERAGGRVALIVTIVDREEDDGMARLAARVPVVEALATRTRILAAAARRTS